MPWRERLWDVLAYDQGRADRVVADDALTGVGFLLLEEHVDGA
jgi:hypothetical protein